MWLLSSYFNAFFVIVSLSIVYLYKHLTAYYTYWQDRGIPYRKPIIAVGNIKDALLGRVSIGKIFKDMYNEYPNEKFVGAYTASKPRIIIRDPDQIKNVLIKDFQTFRERDKNITDKIQKLSANLFAVTGLKWKAIRQKFSPSFTSTKLRNMFHLIVEVAEEFQGYLEKCVKNNEEQEVRELMAKFTTDVIGSCAFGIKMNTISDNESQFRKMGKKVFEASKVKVLKSIVRVLSPRIFELLKLRILGKEVEDFFIDTIKQITQERIQSKERRNDFVDLLLDLKATGYITVENAKKVETIAFTDTFMAAQAFIFFTAGFETSSGLMAFTLFELSKNQDVQKKLLEEINTVMKKHNGKLSYDAISEMTYLDCVISEAMRKYPALAFLTRSCMEEYTFPGTSLTIDSNTTAIIPVLALHYDPQYYPDPKKFDPERFTPEAKLQRHPMVYLPFGEGPRNCIGLRLGKMQSMIGLVSVLQKFTVHDCPKSEPEITIDPRAFVTASKNGIWLKLKPRC